MYINQNPIWYIKYDDDFDDNDDDDDIIIIIIMHHHHRHHHHHEPLFQQISDPDVGPGHLIGLPYLQLHTFSLSTRPASLAPTPSKCYIELLPPRWPCG